MSRILILFASSATAVANVAGVPAMARAAREAALAAAAAPGTCEVVLALHEGCLDDDWCRDEIARLAPGLERRVVTAAELIRAKGDLWFSGELLPSAETITSALRTASAPSEQSVRHDGRGKALHLIDRLGPAGLVQHLGKAGKPILRSTGKQSDGIVSRHLNRAISMRISAELLKARGMRPVHATTLTALTAVLMFVCLISGSYIGLIAGAFLFQAASVIDGVDGEVARATFRTSALGASLDSIIDATTNLAFIMGLGLSLALQGVEDAITLSATGFACLATGLTLLGGHARISGQAVNFEALKDLVRRHPSPVADWLIWLTMRDFLALASAVMVILGFGYTFLLIFAAGSGLWLLTTVAFVASDALKFRQTRRSVISTNAM